MLKIDCEGCEWEALRSVVNGDRKLLPEQIAVELHYQARQQMGLIFDVSVWPEISARRANLASISAELGGHCVDVARAAEERIRAGASLPLTPRSAWHGVCCSACPAATCAIWRSFILYPSAQIAWMDFMYRFGGYHIIARHDNGGCFACTELLLARNVRGPPPARREALGLSGGAQGAGGGEQGYGAQAGATLSAPGGGKAAAGSPGQQRGDDSNAAAAGGPADGTPRAEGEPVSPAAPEETRRQSAV